MDIDRRSSVLLERLERWSLYAPVLGIAALPLDRLVLVVTLAAAYTVFHLGGRHGPASELLDMDIHILEYLAV